MVLSKHWGAILIKYLETNRFAGKYKNDSKHTVLLDQLLCNINLGGTYVFNVLTRRRSHDPWTEVCHF